MNDQPINGTAQQPEQEAPRVVNLTDDQAATMVIPLAEALVALRLYEGAVRNDRVSMRALEGPLALYTAASLIALMRGQDAKHYDVNRTVRDLLRGIPMPPAMEHALCLMHPNAKPMETTMTIKGGDDHIAAKVTFRVDPVPTILLPGAANV